METDISPVYSKPFFELQLIFAQKMADLSQQPFEQAVLESTAFYRILGLDWSFNPTHPVWQEYIQGFQQARDKVDFTYQFYLQRYDSIEKFSEEEHWGCFAYAYHPEHRMIHIHFSDEDRSIYGPLSRQRIDVRKAELRAMFQQILQRHPDVRVVQGGSWLYNWESYKRLFPQEFGQSAKKQARPGLSGRAIWGQFLRRGWKIHEETMAVFLQRVGQLERVEEYGGCFPYAVLLTVAPVELFYEFYGLV